MSSRSKLKSVLHVQHITMFLGTLKSTILNLQAILHWRKLVIITYICKILILED